jgi:magnesium transporter
MMERVIVDKAMYVQGRRTEQLRSLQETYEAVRQRQGVAWIGLYEPIEKEFGSVVGSVVGE